MTIDLLKLGLIFFKANRNLTTYTVKKTKIANTNITKPVTLESPFLHSLH